MLPTISLRPLGYTIAEMDRLRDMAAAKCAIPHISKALGITDAEVRALAKRNDIFLYNQENGNVR